MLGKGRIDSTAHINTKVSAAPECAAMGKSSLFLFLCTNIILKKKSTSHVWVISSTWLAVELLIRGEERLQIKAAPSLQGSLSRTFQTTPPAPHTAARPRHSQKRQQNLCLPCTAAATATTRHRPRSPLIAATLSESPPRPPRLSNSWHSAKHLHFWVVHPCRATPVLTEETGGGGGWVI